MEKCETMTRENDASIMIRDNDLMLRSTLFKTFSHEEEVGVLNSSRDDRALMRVRAPRGLTRISREACCRVIGIKMANGASIKGLTDFRLLSSRAYKPMDERAHFRFDVFRFSTLDPSSLFSSNRDRNFFLFKI